MRTILVTGFNGFIGLNLIPKLRKKFNVIGLSNELSPEINIKQIKYDITKINKKIIPEKISTIVHLAAISDVNFCQNNPEKVFRTNVQGTQQILELARRNDASIVFPSTSHVFGKPKTIPIKENHDKNPTSTYAITKLAGEILCKSYSNSYGMNISIPRFFSIYGPNSPKHSVMYSIIQQIFKKKTIKLGNLKAKRDFLYVDDAINAILIMMKKNHGFNDYNIGFGKSKSIFEVCNLIKKITGKNLPIKTTKNKTRKNDSENIIADISKIKKLGWKPKICMNDGFKLTLDWYKPINRKKS